jgi:hypothetical protein
MQLLCIQQFNLALTMCLSFLSRVDKNGDGRITAEEVKEVSQKNQEFKT